MNQPNTFIATTPEALMQVLGPLIRDAVDEALRLASATNGDPDRYLKYEDARTLIGMSKTRFSQAVNDGAIPFVKNGTRGKLFRVRDLKAFTGYQPVSKAAKQFQHELSTR